MNNEILTEVPSEVANPFANPSEWGNVFEALNDGRILAQMNFSCCGSCGVSDICELAEEEDDVLGYCFYHMQDQECLDRNGYVHLRFGSVSDKEITDTGVGLMICTALDTHGFKYEWDQDPRTCIKVWVRSEMN